jgi:hypothetical protein
MKINCLSVILFYMDDLYFFFVCNIALFNIKMNTLC